MERTTNLKELFGKYYFGSDEIKKVFKKDIVLSDMNIEDVEKYKDTHILIHGCDINILDILNQFGTNDNNEPRFYNQDWYLNEEFILKKLENKWYLLQKDIDNETRGIFPTSNELPDAILITYIFFINYIINNEILWKYDYIWNSDFDHNGDRIYTGRYIDPNNINKNGFSIHRYLTINNNYGMLFKK